DEAEQHQGVDGEERDRGDPVDPLLGSSLDAVLLHLVCALLVVEVGRTPAYLLVGRLESAGSCQIRHPGSAGTGNVPRSASWVAGSAVSLLRTHPPRRTARPTGESRGGS